jgi:hypothetical protein
MGSMNEISKRSHEDEIAIKEIIIKVKEWFIYLLSQWKIIFLAGTVGVLLGLAYSFTRKPIYTASLSFALEDEKSAGGGIGSAIGLASTLGLDIGGGAGGVFAGANLTELFKSRSMVEQALLTPVILDGKTMSLAEMYIEDNGWRENWEKDPNLRNIKFLADSNRKGFTRVHDSIFGAIYNNLSKELVVGQKDKKIAIVSIDVVSSNELFSKYFCEALATKVSQFYVETKSRKSTENMLILKHQTDSIRRELNGAITGIAVSNDENFNLNPALNVRRAPSARRQVDVQANTAILTELIKQTELAKVTVRRETPLIQVIDRPILPLPRQKVGKLKGIFVGGFFAGFLTVLYLVFRRLFKLILK